MARSEFGEFLIARRARLQPEEVGLPVGRRRRTPGLRREEVAALAGVSVDYLARLEQGRDTNPSMAVLGALAEALRLTEVERHHFGRLAIGAEQARECPSSGQAREQVTDTVQAVLDAMHPTPAFVTGRWLDVLAWNPAWQDFAAPLGLFDEVAEHNLATYFFAHPQAPQYWHDWPVAAEMMVSALRAARGEWPEDSGLDALVRRLREIPEFSCRWGEHRVTAFRSGALHLAHPRRGEVEVEIETLSPAVDQSVQVWLVDRRSVSIPALRVVGE